MKRFVVGFIIVVFVLIAGLVALPFLIPTDTIRTAVERRVEEQTGRKLTLAGDIKRSIFPNIGVEVTDVTLANAPWAQDPLMISAKRAVISIKLLPLLSRQIEVNGLILDDPEINLEIGPNGEKNWDLLPAGDESAASAGSGAGQDGPAVKDISLAGVRITNGTVRFSNSQTNERHEASAINMELSLKGLEEPFHVAGDLVWNGEPVSLSLDLETPARIMAQQETSIDFDLKSKPAKIAFKGNVTPLPYSPQLDGDFEVNIPSTAGLADWAGQALPPELADLQSVALKGSAKYTFDGVKVDASGKIVFKDKPTEIKLTVKSDGDPMGGTPVEIDGGITSELITASYKGTATLGLKPLATGSFSLNTPSPAAVAQWLGQPVPPELADLSAIDVTGDIDLAANRMAAAAKGTATYKGTAVDLDLDAKSAGDPMAGSPVEIDSRIASELITASYKGTATLGDKPLATGAFTLKTPSPTAVAQWLGQPVPPELADLSAIDVTGDIDLADNRMAAAAKGTATYKGTAVDLDLDAKSDGDPMAGSPVTLTTRLTSDLISASYDGTLTAGDPVSATGAYSLKTPSPKAVAAWLGQPAAPQLADLGPIDLAGNIDLTSARFKATTKGSVTYKSEPIALALNASAKGSPQNGAPISTRLTAKSSRFSITYRGPVTVGDKPRIGGTLKFSTDSLAKLAAWAGVELGPQGATLGKTSLETKLIAKPQSAVLQDMVLKLDDMVLQGDIRANYAGRPAIRGTLTANALNLDRYLPQTAATPASSSTSSQGWSNEPIDMSGLKAVDANLKLSTKSLRVHGMNIGPTRLHVVLKDGLLTTDIQEINLYGGRGVGKISLDARQKTPRLASTFNLSSLQLRPFLRDAAGFDSIAGTGGFTLSITSSGISQKQLASNLGGKGNIKFLDGAIYGINLPAMLRNVSTAFLDSSAGKDQKTDFAQLTASFNIVKGKLTNQDMSLLGPLLRVLGNGVVDIAAQRLDYRIDPKAVASLAGQGGAIDLAGIAVPILIKGAWSNLKFKPDLSGLVDGILGNPEGALDAAKGLLKGDPKNLLKGQGTGGAAQGLLQGVVGKNPDSPGAQILDSVLGTKKPKQAAPQPSAPGALDRGTAAPAPGQTPAAGLDRSSSQTESPPAAQQPAQPLSKKKKRKKKAKKLLNSIFN